MLTADDAHLDIYLEWAAYRIYLRAKKWVNRIQSQWRIRQQIWHHKLSQGR